MSPLMLIKVVIGENGRTVSFLPNTAKTSGVKLLFFASSAESGIPPEGRKHPTNSVNFCFKEANKKNDLVILTTEVNGQVSHHFLEILCTDKGRRVDLSKQWLRKNDYPVINSSNVQGELEISIALGKGENEQRFITKPDTNYPNAIVVSPDLLCQVAVGRISTSVFKRRAGVTETKLASESSAAEIANDSHQMTPNPIHDVVNTLRSENATLTTTVARLKSELKTATEKTDKLHRIATEFGSIIAHIWEEVNIKRGILESKDIRPRIRTVMIPYFGIDGEYPTRGCNTTTEFLKARKL